VTGGPYRRTRNPMYVAMTLLYLGASLLMNGLWPLLALPVVLAALTFAVIRREERYLSSAFGAEYDAYRRRVRRWL
jgi:protein-S-isoprenylcysteine O-methyltransferase Ste14